ncbi:MAG: hypothetical protein AABW51_03750 [Nanoarchaeota archaeon]
MAIDILLVDEDEICRNDLANLLRDWLGDNGSNENYNFCNLASYKEFQDFIGSRDGNLENVNLVITDQLEAIKSATKLGIKSFFYYQGADIKIQGRRAIELGAIDYFGKIKDQINLVNEAREILQNGSNPH